MPLIVICGRPLSGKSAIAVKINEFFQAKRIKTLLIRDEEQLKRFGPDEIYSDASKEKQLRSWLKSEVQRNLPQSDLIVILDAANYIKGFRYELFCLSKQFKTTYVLVECISTELIDLNNLKNTDKKCYSERIFTELYNRYEPPNSNVRWENPLFMIESGLIEDSLLNGIEAALFDRKALKPNKSTESLPVTTDNFLNELDNQTQEVIQQIQSALRWNQLKAIKITNSEIMIDLNRKFSIAELNRFRRQFINYVRLNPINDKEKITTMFVQFINKVSDES